MFDIARPMTIPTSNPVTEAAVTDFPFLADFGEPPTKYYEGIRFSKGQPTKCYVIVKFQCPLLWSCYVTEF